MGEMTTDVAALARLKRDRGLTISCVIPARNEAPTVGGIVARVRADLVDAVGLLDEVVVMDSDSTDDTAAVAARAGAVVHRAGEVGPVGLGPAPGKGEALWRSQFVTRGDLVAFLDADLTVWGTHFVSGVLAPMITSDDIVLVKGDYERLAADGDIDGNGESHAPAGAQGGRVTELMARPALNLWWPELAAIRQPLGGEWAVRRDVLAQVSVPTGYGIEMAVLIDVYTRHGLGAIAQVDLGARGHTHQDLAALGAMAVEVLAAADARRGRASAASVVPLTQYLGRGGEVREVVTPVRVGERPPAATFAEYGAPR